MNDIFYLDEDEQNWKNSEVISIFASEFFDSPATEVSQTVETDPLSGNVINNELDYEIHGETVEALGHVDDVVNELKKMAEEAGFGGQIKVAYYIERAIEEIRDIGFKLWAKRDDGDFNATHNL